MAIKSPSTYSDWYWKNSVEASAAFDEQKETAFAPFFSGVLAEIPYLDAAPANMQVFIHSLAEPPSAGFGGFALGVGVEMIDETLHTLMNPMMKIMQRSINKRALETWLTTPQVNMLFRQGKIEEDFWKLNTQSEGYEDIIAKFLYESEAPYPTIPDLILYSRYHGDADAPWSEVQNWFDIPARDWPVWKWLAQQRFTTLDMQTLYKRGLVNEYELSVRLAEIGWSFENRDLVKELAWVTPNAMLLVQGNLFQEKSQEEILKDISIAEINPLYAQQYLDAVLTKPSSQDIVAYELRRSPELSNLESQLKRIGIHDDYFSLYRELAYQIPPVADIITMAVREAFTPDIAAKFGQYEDYPTDLEEWAAKKGLAKEWSERYWAAHWSLPSVQQGFEMLHRGQITSDELNLLLRASDVMPFWRDKLTSIAYRRLSRVDIRRMYQVGVMTAGEVFEAYLELGYNDRDAERMADFTVKQILATQSKFTSGDIVTAYSKYMINRSEAESLLRAVGVRDENISFIITTAEYEREWKLTDSRIAAIHNLYRKAVYDDDTARSELLRLNLPAERVDVLMDTWYIDEKDKAPRYWTTAQTLTFIAKGLITPERGRRELQEIGYDAEHINVFMSPDE